jgi:pimeloyl-ACP methyl ester carboxylesterase
VESRTIDLGVPVHYLEAPGEGPHTLVLVHGLGGSSANWHPVLDPLARFGRVLAPDLGGFGLTPPGPEGSGVDANLALLTRFLRARAPGPVVLLGNSMGGALSVLYTAQEGPRVRALVLVDPACPLPPGTAVDRKVLVRMGIANLPVLGPYLVRRHAEAVGPEGLVDDLVKLCFADPVRMTSEVLEPHLAMARRRQGQRWNAEAYVTASRSLFALLGGRRRFHAAVSAVQAPTLVVHGTHDRLIPLASARALAARRPDWTLAVLDGVGHTPQLETPARFLAEVTPWLERALG